MITKELKDAWQRAQTYPDGGSWMVLANAYLEAEAGRRMAEFAYIHQGHEEDICGPDAHKHTWALAEWRAELERELDEN